MPIKLLSSQVSCTGCSFNNAIYSYQLCLHVTGQTSFLRTTDEIIRVYSFLELGNPQQVTHLPHVWDLLLPLAYRHQEGLMVHSTSSERHMLSGVNETVLVSTWQWWKPEPDTSWFRFWCSTKWTTASLFSICTTAPHYYLHTSCSIIGTSFL